MANPSNVSKEAVIDFIAGAVGGTCCAYVGQPLDTIKVKMQAYPDLYKSSVRCGLNIVRKQGFMQLYAGAVPAAAANIGETSVLFLCYGQCTKFVSYLAGIDRDEMKPFHSACAGSIASFFAAFALCPLELIKCRMQTLQEFRGGHQNITPFTIIKDTLRVSGPLGFYQGISSTIMREVPGYFFFFGGYEYTKRLLSGNEDDKDNLGLTKTVIAGGTGGTALWFSIYPFDLIKSRMQVFSSAGENFKMIPTAKLIFKESGIFGFYRGIGPTLVRAFPACGAVFVGYEYSKRFMEMITAS